MGRGYRLQSAMIRDMSRRPGRKISDPELRDKDDKKLGSFLYI